MKIKSQVKAGNGCSTDPFGWVVDVCAAFQTSKRRRRSHENQNCC